MGYDDFTFLDVEVRDSIAFVTLNNLDERNAFSGAGHNELSRIMRRLAADPDVRAGVLTGAGTAFSAGPTAERFAEITSGRPDVSAASMQEVRDMVYGAIDCDKPVACAINGVASGSALTLALLADVIILERHVVLRDSHVAAALTAGDGGVVTWPLAMGLIKAKRYLLTGDPLSADEAERLGLVTEVVDRGCSLARATQYAERWAGGPQIALRSTKRALNQWLRAGSITAFDMSVAFEQLTQGTAEATAALASLRENGIGAIPPDTPTVATR